MKVDFKQPFKDFKGDPILNKDGSPNMINATLGLELFNLGELDKSPLSRDEKFMAYRLSIKIANSDGKTEISKDEAEFLDRVSGVVFKAGAYGNIKELLTQKQ